MITRRLFSMMLGAAPAAGAALTSGLVSQPETAIPQQVMSMDCAVGGAPSPPRMQYDAAKRMLMLQPDVRDRVESSLFVGHRQVGYIDHDIEAKRSWSTMAKVTFQRRRNVDAALADCAGDTNTYSMGVQFLDQKIGELMWGKSQAS